MNRVVHFEIHATNQDAMQKFYETVFGWKFTDMGPQMGNFRIIDTGKDAPDSAWKGINGGLTPRKGVAPAGSEPVNAYVCTIDVADIDTSVKKVTDAGGSIALEKMRVPTVGWLAYGKDPEGNIFGMLQAEAK